MTSTAFIFCGFIYICNLVKMQQSQVPAKPRYQYVSDIAYCFLAL